MQKESLFTKLIRRRTLMMLLMFVLLLAVFGLLSGGLVLRTKNLMNILNAMAISTFLATGVAMLMISGRLDLSTGASGTLCGMVLAFVLRAGMPLLPALLCAFGIGALIGLINALLVNELRIAPFIATLASSQVATGMIYLIANKKSIDILDPILKAYGKNMILGYFPITALVAFGLMVFIGIILHKTKFGRQIYLVGGNPEAAMLSGVNPKKMSYKLFIICGLFSSAAGITFVSRMQTANIQGLVAQRFQGITAAVLGGISFGGGSGGMVGAFVGLLVLNTFSNGMTVMGVSPYWQNVAQGLLLIFALMLDYFQKKQSMKAIA